MRHREMDTYSRYPEVHIIKRTSMKELTKVLNGIIEDPQMAQQDMEQWRTSVQQ